MIILVFTEGTILMHGLAKDVSREERIKQSRQAGMQREESSLAYETNTPPPPAKPGSPYDIKSYIPNGNCVEKLKSWKNQGATIYYLTSRRIKSEIDTIENILKKYNFPYNQNLLYRKRGEAYKDVAERLMPDILVEDDCESIGGEVEMTYPHIKPKLKQKIRSVVVKEFAGIDDLPGNITKF